MATDEQDTPALVEAERLTAALYDFADELDRLGDRVRRLARERVAEQEGNHDRHP